MPFLLIQHHNQHVLYHLVPQSAFAVSI